MIQLPGGTFMDMENISNFSIKEAASGVFSTYAESITGGTFLFSDGWPSMDSAIACLAAFLGSICPNFNWELPPIPSALGSFCDFATDMVPTEIKDAVDGVKNLGFSESTALGKISGGLGGSSAASTSLSSLANPSALGAISSAAAASSLLSGTGKGLPTSLWDTTGSNGAYDGDLKNNVNSASKSIADSSTDAWGKAKDVINSMTSTSSLGALDSWV